MEQTYQSYVSVILKYFDYLFMMIFFLTGRLTSLDFHIFNGVCYVIEPCVNDVF